MVLLNQKRWSKSLVENIHKDMFTDIILGKGGCCVFLLQGPPRTDKVKSLFGKQLASVLPKLTLDYYVDNFGRQDIDSRSCFLVFCAVHFIVSMSASLGSSRPKSWETLKKILEVAETSNAVVLIDKCDILLTRWNMADVLRNAMVGIFFVSWSTTMEFSS